MAACAAAGRAWGRVGAAGLPPLAGGFRRQSHRTSVYFPWPRTKAPHSPHRGRQNGCRVLLLRPVYRCQGTAAAAAGVQAIPPAATPPVENALSTADVIQAVQEPSFAELGLGAYTPVGLIQSLFESLHVGMGLPWWGAIAAGTVLVRCLAFPVSLKAQQEAVKLSSHALQITKLTTRIRDAKKSGNNSEFAKAYSELAHLQKTHAINPLRGFLLPLIQAPIFISFFFALRNMAELPVPSLQTGGLWWFLDLTAADPYYVLPLTVTATMWAVMELGAESGMPNQNFRMMKNVSRVMPLIILPITISFPTAIIIYWLTSNLFSLVQASVLRLPAIRTRLRVPV
ncbi:mitochondrial inner membrane protein OXA1L [Varanus komodoensis]|uniref:mitochondrial inner membrane protein OXA1L n=1 Tax=Varanus komodoensis TaxID=61221 RepID=UPI001CF7C238|nr:mitochondrial inner membrane protein OXA1L [Varanus komodoensis]